MPSIRDLMNEIVHNSVGSSLYYAGVQKAKSGIFNPITQTVQAILTSDGCVIDDCKLYTVAGIKYTMIPPGTDMLIGFVDTDPNEAYVIGIDPNAQVLSTISGIMTVSAAGMVVGAGIITLTKDPASV